MCLHAQSDSPDNGSDQDSIENKMPFILYLRYRVLAYISPFFIVIIVFVRLNIALIYDVSNYAN